MAANPEIAALRRRIQSLETSGAQDGGRLADVWGARPVPPLSLGHAGLDAHFGSGGLAWGSHQIAACGGGPTAPKTFGFMLLARYLAAHPFARALVVQEASALRETGQSYGPGLHALGLDPDRLVWVQTHNGAQTLGVINEALRARTPEIVLADLWDGAALADLSATRRFNLAAHKARALVLLTTPDLSSTSAALTRWRVASAPSPVARRRLGAPALFLDLVRNRHGRTGRWALEWNSHDRVFNALRSSESGGPISSTLPSTPAAMAAPLVAAAFDRPGQARAASAILPFGAYRQAG